MDNYKVRKIDDHTWQLEDPFYTYLYLIEGTERAVLFDTGNGFSGLREIILSLTDKPVSIILSHGHFDHTGNIDLFTDCYINEDDVPVVASGLMKEQRQIQMQEFSELYDRKLSNSEFEYLVNKKMPEYFGFLRDKDVVQLGDRELLVIETPGHTKGSICILDIKNRYLFSGDTVCNNEILVYFDHSTTVEDVKISDEKLLSYRADFDEIWPGHHDCPLNDSYIEDYISAADTILADPSIGKKVILKDEYKYLYNYKSIGISYAEAHVHNVKH